MKSFILFSIIFSLLLCFIAFGNRFDEISTVFPTTKGPAGVWKTTDFCPFGSYDLGFTMRVDEFDVDSFGVNKIELDCYDYNNV